MGSYLRRRLPLVLAAAATVAVSGGVATGSTAKASSDRASRSYLIQASASFQRLGDFRVRDEPTYQGAIDALGAASACRIVGSGNHAVATWRSLGVRIELWTYGGLPAGKNGCSAPEAIWIDSLRITSRRWYTSLGLRVGDSGAKLRRLYPRALHDPRDGWPRPGSYWLVTRRTACLGDCGATRYVTVPQLLAEVRNSRVTAFHFHVGAQGE